ncbi:hypothetical protein [Dongia sp. agr-C8]
MTKLAAVLACAGGLLQGCYIPNDHPAYGAEDFKRVEDAAGRPTYAIEGKVFYGMDPEREAKKVIAAACPTGNPTLLAGNAYSFNGQDRYGAPASGTFWYATFSCDQVIPLN